MSDRLKLRLIMSCGLTFLLSAYISCEEFKYAISGRDAVATIERTVKANTTRGRATVKVIGVRYSFVEEDGTAREDKMNMPVDWTPPADMQLQVQYVPGKPGMSRLAGEHQYVAVTICLGTLAAVIGGFVYLFRKAYE